MKITESNLRKIIRRTITESFFSQWKKLEDEKQATARSRMKFKTPDEVVEEVIQGIESGIIDIEHMTPAQVAEVYCNRARVDSAKFYVADKITEYLLGK